MIDDVVVMLMRIVIVSAAILKFIKRVIVDEEVLNCILSSYRID